MFNRKASSSKSMPDEVIEALSLKGGYKIADIGAGGGYFSFRCAEEVGPDGRVYAVDTDPDLSKFVEETARKRNLTNVVTVLSDGKTLDLPKDLDLIFLRNVTHHIDNRVDYFTKLRDFLGGNGRVAIIEYRHANRFSMRGVFGHFVPVEDLLREMREAGYRLEEDLRFLPEQSFTIYSRAE